MSASLPAEEQFPRRRGDGSTLLLSRFAPGDGLPLPLDADMLLRDDHSQARAGMELPRDGCPADNDASRGAYFWPGEPAAPAAPSAEPQQTAQAQLIQLPP